MATNTMTTKTAMFAGGCFWCMQPSFDNATGVIETKVGYSGDSAKNATYEKVSSGTTKHREVIQITYDPAKTNFVNLVDIYLSNIDPTDEGGQFADRGYQYETVIYYDNEIESAAALQSLNAIANKFFPEKIRVKILPTSPFFEAENYHQKYYQKNSVHYNAYKIGSGRASFIEKHKD